MNEIEKLYKLAGVETSPYCCDTSCGEPTERCKDCADYREVYPPFTAEKQLELIKWLSDTDCYIHNLYKTIDTKEYCIENDFYNVQANEFEEALASLINKLWHFLTKKEKQQIKEILK